MAAILLKSLITAVNNQVVKAFIWPQLTVLGIFIPGITGAGVCCCECHLVPHRAWEGERPSEIFWAWLTFGSSQYRLGCLCAKLNSSVPDGI